MKHGRTRSPHGIVVSGTFAAALGAALMNLGGCSNGCDFTQPVTSTARITTIGASGTHQGNVNGEHCSQVEYAWVSGGSMVGSYNEFGATMSCLDAVGLGVGAMIQVQWADNTSAGSCGPTTRTVIESRARQCEMECESGMSTHDAAVLDGQADAAGDSSSVDALDVAPSDASID